MCMQQMGQDGKVVTLAAKYKVHTTIAALRVFFKQENLSCVEAFSESRGVSLVLSCEA